MNYYEVDFGNKDNCGCDSPRICIRGTRQPSIEEAQRFCEDVCAMVGLPVCAVHPIDEVHARAFYDFSNEANWPIFQ